MEGTHLPLRLWYIAMFLILNTAKPISAMSLHHHLDVQYRTCWHLLHRLRAMMERGEQLPLAGTIEADETHVGGKARNRQKHRDKPGRGRGTSSPMIFAAIERSGEARAAVIPSASAVALDPLMFRWFDRTSILSTDELAVYDGSAARCAGTIASTIRLRSSPGPRTASGFMSTQLKDISACSSGDLRHSPSCFAETPASVRPRAQLPIQRCEHETGARIARCLIGSHGQLRLRELFA